MAKLKQEKLVPKSEMNGRYALADTLKRAGMSFQRTRYSLKKRDPLRFEQISKDVGVHLAQEAAGLVRVLFGDESGFTENPSLTQAWAPKGEPHAHEMNTDTRARLNGIGCSDFNLNPVSMCFKDGRVGGADFRAWGNALAAKCQSACSNSFVAGQRAHPHGQSHPGDVSRLGEQGGAYSLFVAVFP